MTELDLAPNTVSTARGGGEPRRLRATANQARDRGDWASAAEQYRRYLGKRPGDFAIWVQLGHALKEDGRRIEALVAYSRALALDDRNADLLLNLGHLHKLMGHRELAIDFYRRSAEADGNPHARTELSALGLAIDLPAARPPAPARRTLADATGWTRTRARIRALTQRKTRRLLARADQARDRRDWPAAAELYRAYLRAKPDHFAIWVQLGHALKEARQLDEALAAYSRALSLNDKDADLLLNLAHLHKMMGFSDLAIDFYRRSFDQDKNVNAITELKALGAWASSLPLQDGRKNIGIHFQYESDRTDKIAFDEDFYVSLYPHIVRSGLSPLQHYREIGIRKFYHPAFDEEWYREEYPDLQNIGENLKEHFLRIGKTQARHPTFKSDWYSHEYPDVAESGLDSLEHYRRYGRRQGRHASFDPHFYITQYIDIGLAGIDPYEHYEQHGRREGRHPAFNRAWYLLAYRDIRHSSLDPYDHYKAHGRAEGRPLPYLSFRSITRWGTPNIHSDINAPSTIIGDVPAPHGDFCPKVSVIVPNYNHAEFLVERLDSIYNQSYCNIEVILLDDASTDNSRDVLIYYADRYAEKTKYVFNNINSGGVFYQWKRGLEIASGDLIWIAESDDFCSLDFLAELVRFFRNNAVMLAFSRTDFVMGPDVKTVWTSEAYWADVGFELGSEPVIKSAHEIVKSVWGARNIAPNVSGVLFRNPGKIALLDDLDWLRLRMCGDWVFYLSLIRGGLVGYSPRVTNFYRQHPQNTSIGTHDKDIYYEEHAVTATYLARLYNVEATDIRRHESILYNHWRMKRGAEADDQFASLFGSRAILEQLKFRKPNICIAIYALVPGGGETFPILVANLLYERGYAVTVLNFEREKTNPGIKGMINPAIPIIELENSADTGQILDKLGIELVHSHHAWADITLAISLKDFPAIKHIVTMHGMYELLSHEDLRHYESDLESVDAFVYIADKNLGHFSTRFNREKVFTKITNTVALHPLKKLSRSELGIPQADFVLCLASRAVADKGWDEAIEAIILANSKSKRAIHLILVGNGPEHDRLTKISFPYFIHLLGFKPNVRDYFSIADAGLIASRFKGESCPLVLIECLSVGKPVISSDIGEVRNMLNSEIGMAGIMHKLVDWSIDTERLSEIIKDLANDPVTYERMKLCAPAAMAKFDQDKIIDRYTTLYNDAIIGTPRRSIENIRLSVILVAYNMERELIRTIRTFAPAYQNFHPLDYEIIVIDNGSSCDYDLTELHQLAPNLKFVRFDGASQSPVNALNYGISLARGAVICACIDAARMASPGLLGMGLSACNLHPRAVVGSLSFHLGHAPQNESVRQGYNQAIEDVLLETVNWQANGYELFDIASFDPSSRSGFYACPAEANALFMARDLWTECGGFHPGFRSRGGGLANLDLWRRLCDDDRNLLVVLFGEGTFHQFHGGVATNALVDVWTELHAEYMSIRGYEFRIPHRQPYLFGKNNIWAFRFEGRIIGHRQAVSPISHSI